MKIDLTQEESETICTLIEGFKIRSEKNLQSVFMPDHYKNQAKERIKRCYKILNKLQKKSGEEDEKDNLRQT
jgi:hypothetical protein|tara:strand:+ start:443 stop:658 length:216 start_codon:yes stop_codon:yes gene_type:complete